MLHSLWICLGRGGGGGGDARKMGVMPAIHKDNRGKFRQPLGLVGRLHWGQVQKCLECHAQKAGLFPLISGRY